MKMKGQIKIGETIGVMFILYIVIFMGFTWFARSSEGSNIEFIKNEALEKAYINYHYFVNHPLLRKTQHGYLESEQVLNLISLETFVNHSQKYSDYYISKLGESTVTVKMYNISSTGELTNFKTLVIYNKTPDYIDFGKKNFFTLMNVYDPLTKKKYLSILNVEVKYSIN